MEELILPEEFDETYTQYLELQAGQGFDLEAYRGKRVKRYTYEITNYPTGEQGIQAGFSSIKIPSSAATCSPTSWGALFTGWSALHNYTP